MNTVESFAQERRKNDLAKIHIAKKQLGLDDETYRAMLLARGGASSAKDLSADGLAKALKHLTANGFKGKKGKKTYAQRPNTTDKTAQLQKIEAQLADLRLPWAYVTARQAGKGDSKTLSMLERLTKKQRLEWCTTTELSKVITALDRLQKQRKT